MAECLSPQYSAQRMSKLPVWPARNQARVVMPGTVSCLIRKAGT